MAGNQGIPVIGPVLNKIIGTRNERFVKKYTGKVDQINSLEAEIRPLTDDELRARFRSFKQRVEGGEKADAMLAEVFAVAREAMDRSVGIRNTLNPEHEFDASRLPEAMQAVHAELMKQAEATPVMVPRTFMGESPEGSVPDEKDEFLGSSETIPGWMRVEIPVEYYGAVRELYPESRPPFRARPFDVQLLGAMVLSQGRISEMKTGEGKTIVAPLATCLAAVEGLKIHVVTVNDYLVQRDRDWTFPFFRALGMTVGAIHPQHMQPEEIKRQMYRCDVVYGTTSEFGFDYLRDNMKRSVAEQVQRRREFAIVDEVDSILIDEARTPLIISGPAHEDRPRYEQADELARHLVELNKPWTAADEKLQEAINRIKTVEGDIRTARDKDAGKALQNELNELRKGLPEMEAERDQHTQYYEVKMERKQAYLTHEGIAEAQKKAGVGSFYVDENMDLPHLMEQALRAYVVYERDRDYVIMNVPSPQTGQAEPSVVIVDTFTGRPMIGRQWSDGLHQAVEAKEQVPVKQETQTVATVTIQNFFKMYERLAGMTGTADTEAQEFNDIYSLDVVSIPTNREVVRADHDDLMFLREKDKWEAIVDEIKAFHDVGRPILVGTTSVERSEFLGKMLQRKHGVKHEVLNAKQHEREAHIVVNAGQLGAVMIATNMAGRGTDIKLGKCPREVLIDHWLRRGIASRDLKPEASEDELRENVFRKIALTELKDAGLSKRDIEQMPFDEVEVALLRRWAEHYTYMTDKQVQACSRDELMAELDACGRFLIHRIRWFDDIQDMGGLHVIGTERHESRRIDNQLRGRSGRQGDNGSTRFFVSLEDPLMKMFAGAAMQNFLSKVGGMKEGDAIEHPWLSKSFMRAQRKVEERNFQIRKNILEYDEVMEHQRQYFYGLRQRVLEGRDVKGLVLNYIDVVIDEACEQYLDRDYPAECAAEYAKQQLDCSIMPDRLRGKDYEEMDKAIRREAKEDARQMIDLTLGEYMPLEGSEVSVDFDSAGLINWAKSRFDVDLNAAELREGGAEERRQVFDTLVEKAHRRIEESDLAGLARFTEPDYGATELASWTKNRFGFDVDLKALVQAEDAEDNSAGEHIKQKARDIYHDLEVRYPAEFAMNVTRNLMRTSPGEALGQLSDWANRRYQLGLDDEQLRKVNPAALQKQIETASREFVDSGRLDKEISDALACPNDDALDAHLKQRFNLRTGVPDWMRGMRGEQREGVVRGRVEELLRAEMLHLERMVLLEGLDNQWRDHLYQMDQLRDGISFRAFSQQDPRIAFKREGATLFTEMQQSVRTRVTDYIFKIKVGPEQGETAQSGLGPMVGGPSRSGGQQQQAPRGIFGGPPAAARPAGGGQPPMGGGNITGPGMG
ncbi:MAG: preprotein translocase subunit SecA [Phycisphaerales bacterium]|nr:preprotein translocase subunit SecA [Phycisphaerales bacterium]